MTLLSDTAYPSFIGEVEALNTTTIRRLIPSARHQLPAIALRTLEPIEFLNNGSAVRSPIFSSKKTHAEVNRRGRLDYGSANSAGLRWEHATAASMIERALALNPNSANAWMASGWLSCYRNQPEAAIGAFERAMRLSPFDPLGFSATGGLALAH